VKKYVSGNYTNHRRLTMLAILIEFLLDCLWILSQCVIGSAAIMLMIIGGVAIRSAWHDIMRERRKRSWKKKD